MTAPHIHGHNRGFSVSDALDTIGKTLSTIRDEDRLSWKDVGRILGKSDDRASDYAKALSEMPVSAFLLACREWNGRFGNPVMQMIGQKLSPLNADEVPDNEKLTRLLALAHLLCAALADDGVVDDAELDAIPDATLDDAARGIDALRMRKAATRRQHLAAVPSN